MGFDQYFDASHFILLSMFFIVIGALLLSWKQSCKDGELRNESTSNRMRISGATLVTAGSVALLLSAWLFSATVYGTRRVRVRGYGGRGGYNGMDAGYGSGGGYGGGYGSGYTPNAY